MGNYSSWSRQDCDAVATRRSEFEYSIVAESTEAHPASFGPGAVTAPTGWGSYSVALYADCVVEDTWSPFAELAAGALLETKKSSYNSITLVQRLAQNLLLMYTMARPLTHQRTKQRLAHKASLRALEFYSTTIPLPSPGDGIYVQVTVLPITTGGESLAEESEINLTQLVNCPESLVLDISMGFICGTTVQGLIINNELSSQSVTIKATQYLSPDSSSGPWKLGEVYSDVPSVKRLK